MKYLLSAGFLTMLGACSNSDNQSNSWGGSTRVTEIYADDAIVPIGDGTVFRFNFTFNEEDVFNDQGSVNLVVKVPPQLAYRTGSAEIDGDSSREDESVEPYVLKCSKDGTYLSFTLIRYDLDNAQAPGDDADAQLKLTLDGKEYQNNVVVEAAADNGAVAFGCKTTFIPDEQEVVSVR
jgi:hypothetical protein